VTCAPGRIISTRMNTSIDGSFNSVIRFHSPRTGNQPNLYGKGLGLRGKTSHMVLMNTTTNSILVAPQFTPSTGRSPYALPEISLGPDEVREVDLSPLVQTARRRRDLDVVSVEVVNTSGPGSVIGSLYAIDDNNHTSYDIPLRDSG